MKKFTDTQKKWALTATMIAALGCSVSFNPHTKGFASLDLASSEDVVRDELLTGDGEFDITIAKSGKKTTTVVSPKEVEGKSPVDCGCLGTGTFVIDQEYKNDANTIKKLKSATIAMMNDIKLQKKEVVKDASDTKEEKSRRRERESKDDNRSEVDDEYSDLASYIDDACLGKNKSNSDRRERRNVKSLTCVSDKFLSYIQKYEISDSVTVKYYKSNMERKLFDRIKNGDRFGSEEGAESTDEAYETITTLLRELPEGTSMLRRAIVLTSSKAVAKSASDARDMVATAASTRSTADLSLAIDQINATGRLASNLQVMNQDALFDLSGDNNISMSEAKSIYSSAYGRIVQDIRTGMPKWIPVQAFTNPAAINIDAYQIPTVSTDFRSGLSSSLPPGVLVAPGYENSNPGDWSNRGVNPTNVNGNLISPQRLQNGTSNGAEFGRPRSLSQEAQIEADRRGLLQRRY